MLFAFAATLVDVTNRLLSKDQSVVPMFVTTFVMIIPGAIIGTIAALRVAMTSMPELIALLHSFVGFAATVIGIAQHFATQENPIVGEDELTVGIHRLETILGLLIGGVTLVGSLIAFGKLNGKIKSKPLLIPGRHIINIIAGLVAVLCCVMYLLPGKLIPEPYGGTTWVLLGTAVSFFVGWHMIMAIGGADMPVVVSMLNSYSGWATSASGLMLDNSLMVVVGALVGSSGAILSYIMCTAMARSFVSVILGGFGEGAGAPAVAAAAPTGEMKAITAQETIDLFKNIKSLVIIPGYGMAVAKSQHTVFQMTKLLRARGCNVRFAIHPVAGRLPGHMNVLLAEAKVPYDIVLEMDEINPDLPKTDCTLVIGANDIVNPDALDNPASPIANMPVIHAWEAKTCIVVKRGKGTGYSGIENPLFFKSNTRMLYGDANKVALDIVAGLTQGGAAPAPAAAAATERTPLVQDAPKPEVQETYPEPKKTIGVPLEVFPNEYRVACTPDTAKELRKFGFAVTIQHNAGEQAKFPDEMYQRVGCTIVEDPRAIWECDVVLKVRPPMRHPQLGVHEAELLKPNHVLVSFIYPSRDAELVQLLQASRGTVIAMDCVPRITTAQKLDALSSMGGVMGYRAVVEAANFFPRYFTGQMTAAGKVVPAKVLIIGAGVAGLAAIGAAKGLGAIVRAFDVRPTVRDQIESMGGEFLTVNVTEDGNGGGGYAKKMSDRFIEAEHELFGAQAKEVDIIITTAQIPNQRAPILITTPMVQSMKPGSVIVDLASETGGNCQLTQQGETIRTQNGVTIIGAIDLPSRMASQSSQLYSKNMVHMMDECGRGEKFNVDIEKNPITIGCCIIHNGELRWPQCTKMVQPPEAKKALEAAKPAAAAAPAAPATTAQAIAAPATAPAMGVGSTEVDTKTEERKALEAECTWCGASCYPAWTKMWSCLCVVTWCICPWWWCVKPCAHIHEKAPACQSGPVFKWASLFVLACLWCFFAFFAQFEILDHFVIFVFAIFIGYMVIWNVTPALHTPLMAITNAVSGIIICGGVFEIGTRLWSISYFLGALAVLFASINVFGGFIVTQRMVSMFVRDEPKGDEKKKGHGKH
eukprot:GAFH01000730.1.p2 GENE.GAFH01000730.1~~GAFH01000730.1.p2  ORF type:complete len:1167 (-),score=459.04 GAFH01000730.1:279-3569(-)